MSFLTIVAILSIAASPTQPDSAARPSTDPSDATKIYEAFLGRWSGKEHHRLNIAKSADLPTPEDIHGYSKCVKDGGGEDVAWTKATSIPDLSGTISQLDYIEFVDPKKWRPRDPADLISKGQSVESAVDAGFSAGLMTLSAINFDKSHLIAAFTYSFSCGALCGNGSAVVFAKTSRGWAQAKYSCGSWISDLGGDLPGSSWQASDMMLARNGKARPHAADKFNL